MENDWWLKKAHEIQGYADTNNLQAVYDAIKSLYGPQKRRITLIRSTNVTILHKDKQGILERWAEHFNNLLIIIIIIIIWLTPLSCSASQSAHLREHELDDPPMFSKVLAAVRSLKDNKSAGPDWIPAEALKNGRYLLTKHLHQLIQIIWAQKTAPQDWKGSHIVTIHKKRVTSPSVETAVAYTCSLWQGKH